MKRYLLMLIVSWTINAYCADYDWNGTGATPPVSTPANWIPAGPPGANDTGVFADFFGGISFTPFINSSFTVGTLNFTDNSSFTFTMTSGNTTLNFEGAGIVNPGTGIQTFNVAGGNTAVLFVNNSSAGNSIFNLTGAGPTATTLTFGDTSTAGSGTFNLNNSGVTFQNNPTNQNATFNLTNGSAAFVYTGDGLGNALFNVNGSTFNIQPGGTGGLAAVNLTNGSSLNVRLNSTPPTLGSVSGTAGTSINLVSNLIVGGDNASTLFAGSITDIAGSNDFIKTGTGTLTLSGASSSTGETIVNGGIIDLTGSIASTAVANSGGTFNISGTVGGGATTNTGGILNIMSGGIVTGSVTGTGGTLNILSGGIVTANANASGNTINLAGTVNGNGSVSGGGTFGLGGSILGNFVANSGGTVTSSGGSVTGTYTQNGGSFFLVNSMTPLNVTGAVTLNGGEVEVANAPLVLNIPFSILHSTTSVTGVFSSVISLSPLVVPSLSYGPDDVFLLLSTQFTQPTMTPNQRQLSQQLNQLNPADPDQAALLAALLSLSASAYADALDQLSGVQYADLIHVNEVTNRRFLRNIYDPFRPDFVCPCNVRSCENNVAWSSIQGGQLFLASDSNAKGLNGYDGGVSLGTHHYFNPSLAIGVAGNYSYDHLTFKQGGSGNGNSYLGALYGMYESSRGYFFGEAVGGYTHWNMKRPMAFDSYSQTALSSFNVSHLALYGEAGANVWVNCLLLQPFAGLEYGHYWRSTANERGAAAATLIISNQNLDDLQSRLGGHLSATYGNLLVSADAAWRHRYSHLGDELSVSFASFGSDFTTLGPELNRDSFDGELYIGTRICADTILYLQCFGETGRRNSDYSVALGVQTNW